MCRWDCCGGVYVRKECGSEREGRHVYRGVCRGEECVSRGDCAEDCCVRSGVCVVGGYYDRSIW